MGAKMRMHLTIIIVAVAAVAASIAGCTNQATQSPTPGAPASFLLYSNKNAGVEMSYPSDWQLTGNPAVDTIAQFQHGNDSIVSLQIVTNQSGKTPQSLAASLIRSLQQGNTSTSILENHTASLGGLPGYEIVFTFKEGGQTYKALIVWTVKGSSVYEVQFYGTEAQYNEQISTAQQMISSFEFI
jgi:hypothetical protein